MIISPRTFIKEHRNESIEVIIETRDKLIDDIKDLEKIVFSKYRSSDVWDLNPTPDVQYQVKLEYLLQVCILLSERYNEKYEV